MIYEVQYNTAPHLYKYIDIDKAKGSMLVVKVVKVRGTQFPDHTLPD